MAPGWMAAAGRLRARGHLFGRRSRPAHLIDLGGGQLVGGVRRRQGGEALGTEERGDGTGNAVDDGGIGDKHVHLGR